MLLGCFFFFFFFLVNSFFFSSFVFLDRGLPTMLAVLFVLERLVFFSCMFSVDRDLEWQSPSACLHAIPFLLDYTLVFDSLLA